ncbi:MAG: hypothetical protein ABI836_13695 [Gemmatimonadota bacterium]
MVLNRSAPMTAAKFRPQDRDGDPTVVLEVAGEVDRRHLALPQLALHAV